MRHRTQYALHLAGQVGAIVERRIFIHVGGLAHLQLDGMHIASRLAVMARDEAAGVGRVAFRASSRTAQRAQRGLAYAGIAARPVQIAEHARELAVEQRNQSLVVALERQIARYEKGDPDHE